MGQDNLEGLLVLKEFRVPLAFVARVCNHGGKPFGLIIKQQRILAWEFIDQRITLSIGRIVWFIVRVINLGSQSPEEVLEILTA